MFNNCNFVFRPKFTDLIEHQVFEYQSLVFQTISSEVLFFVFVIAVL